MVTVIDQTSEDDLTIDDGIIRVLLSYWRPMIPIDVAWLVADVTKWLFISVMTIGSIVIGMKTQWPILAGQNSMTDYSKPVWEMTILLIILLTGGDDLYEGASKHSIRPCWLCDTYDTMTIHSSTFVTFWKIFYLDCISVLFNDWYYLIHCYLIMALLLIFYSHWLKGSDLPVSMTWNDWRDWLLSWSGIDGVIDVFQWLTVNVIVCILFNDYYCDLWLLQWPLFSILPHWYW